MIKVAKLVIWQPPTPISPIYPTTYGTWNTYTVQTRSFRWRSKNGVVDLWVLKSFKSIKFFERHRLFYDVWNMRQTYIWHKSRIDSEKKIEKKMVLYWIISLTFIWSMHFKIVWKFLICAKANTQCTLNNYLLSWIINLRLLINKSFKD